MQEIANKLEPLLSEFEKIQLTIDILKESEADSASDQEQLERFEEDHFNAIKKIKTLLRCTNNAIPSNLSDNQSNLNSNSRISNSHVNLPSITLPKFSGSYIEWTSFRELFLTLVHNKPELDNIQKFHYLKCTLNGDAAKTRFCAFNY